MHTLLSILAAVVVGTWNGNWFPSGRAEHRAHPDVEEATVTAVAKMLARGLDAIDPAGTNDVILCLNEIRGPRVASNLVARIGRTNLVVASISAYRRRDRFDQQQDVIATTLPVVEKGWAKWKPSGKTTPPRGYAFAALRLDPCSPEENKTVTLTMSDITLNAADTLPAVWQYFVPTWYQAFCLVLYPALAAAAVSMGGAVVTERKRK